MRYLIASMLALNCAVCASNRPAAVSAADGPTASGAMISRLVGRHDVIVVRAGATGATYSLETKSGEVVVPAATLGKLAMTKPTLSRAVRTMQASNDWAGIDTGFQD
jgi:hypothetical protein